MPCHISKTDTHEGGPCSRELAPGIILEMLEDLIEHAVRNLTFKMHDYRRVARTPVRKHVGFFKTKNLRYIQPYVIQSQLVTTLRAEDRPSDLEFIHSHAANRRVTIEYPGQRHTDAPSDRFMLLPTTSQSTGERHPHQTSDVTVIERSRQARVHKAAEFINFATMDLPTDVGGHILALYLDFCAVAPSQQIKPTSVLEVVERDVKST